MGWKLTVVTYLILKAFPRYLSREAVKQANISRLSVILHRLEPITPQIQVCSNTDLLSCLNSVGTNTPRYTQA
jgi:hypothetical protein